MIISNHTQPRQPRLGSDPLARGILAWQTGDDLRGFTHTATKSVVNTARGRAQDYSTASSTMGITSRTQDEVTMLSVFKATSTAAEQAIMSVGGSGGANLFYLVGGTNPTLWNNGTQGGNGTIVAGQWYVLIATLRVGVDAQVWIDGKKQFSFVPPSSLTVDTIALGGYWASGSLSGSYRRNGASALDVVWDRKLSESELRAVSANPWAIFAREPQDYYAALSSTAYNFIPADGVATTSALIPSNLYTFTPANGVAVASALVPLFRFVSANGTATASALAPTGFYTFVSANGVSTTSALSPTTDFAWDAPGSWNSDPTSPCSYTSEVKDLGTVLTGQVDIPLIDSDSSEVIEIRTSIDNITFTAWGTASASFTARFVQLRVTLTATIGEPVPVLRELQWQVSADLKREYLDNYDPSYFAGAYRIAVGDIRVPTANTYPVIKTMLPTIQDPTADTWDAPVLIDKNVALGWRWQFKKAGVLSDPPLIDFYIEGI